MTCAKPQITFFLLHIAQNHDIYAQHEPFTKNAFIANHISFIKISSPQPEDLIDIVTFENVCLSSRIVAYYTPKTTLIKTHITVLSAATIAYTT